MPSHSPRLRRQPTLRLLHRRQSIASHHRPRSRGRSRPPVDGRAVRRHNSAPRALPRPMWRIAPYLVVNPKLHLLVATLSAARAPQSWVMCVHTAASRHAQWRSVGMLTRVPHVLSVPCMAEQVSTRLIRVCVYQRARRGGMGKEVGFCIVRMAAVLAASHMGIPGNCFQAQLQNEVMGGRECGVMAMAIGRPSESRRGVTMDVSTGMSMVREVRGCWMQVWTVSEARAMLVAEIASKADRFGRVEISKEVMWFGGPRESSMKIRIQFVRKWWRRRFVMGSLEIEYHKLNAIREGDLLKIGWVQSPTAMEGIRCVVVDGLQIEEDRTRLELRLSR